MTDVYSENRVRKIIRGEFNGKYFESKVRTIVREETDDIREELRHLGIKFESFEDKLDTMLGMMGANFTPIETAEDHGMRITALEADNKLIKSIITDK